MKRKILLQLVVPLLSLCMLFLLLAVQPDPASRSVEPVELSVILRETDTAALNAARQGMEQAAADLNAELRLLTLTTAGSGEEQRVLLEREVSGGAGGVVLVPADRETLADSVRQAAGQVPVVTMETDMRESGAKAWVGADNATLGTALGKAALNGVRPGETVLLLDSLSGDNAVRERLEAAAAVLKTEGRTVEVCTPGERPLSDALKTALSELRPSLVMAFEAGALETAASVLETVEQPAPLLYGAGASTAIAAGLEQGRITAIAAQNEFAAGYLAVEAAVRLARHQTWETEDPLEFSILRRENMYEPDSQKLLFPVIR